MVVESVRCISSILMVIVFCCESVGRFQSTIYRCAPMTRPPREEEVVDGSVW